MGPLALILAIKVTIWIHTISLNSNPNPNPNPNLVADHEAEFLLESYDTDNSILRDTCDLVIQFGYVTCFASAFPAVTTFAFVCNILKMKGKIIFYFAICIYI